MPNIVPETPENAEYYRRKAEEVKINKRIQEITPSGWIIYRNDFEAVVIDPEGRVTNTHYSCQDAARWASELDSREKRDAWYVRRQAEHDAYHRVIEAAPDISGLPLGSRAQYYALRRTARSLGIDPDLVARCNPRWESEQAS